MTKILNRLDERGLIERPYNPLDGRSRLVRLTPQGLDRLEQAMESVIDHQRLFMSPLQAEEQGELTRLLEKLVAAAEQPGQL